MLGGNTCEAEIQGSEQALLLSRAEGEGGSLRGQVGYSPAVLRHPHRTWAAEAHAEILVQCTGRYTFLECRLLA